MHLDLLDARTPAGSHVWQCGDVQEVPSYALGIIAALGACVLRGMMGMPKIPSRLGEHEDRAAATGSINDEPRSWKCSSSARAAKIAQVGRTMEQMIGQGDRVVLPQVGLFGANTMQAIPAAQPHPSDGIQPRLHAYTGAYTGADMWRELAWGLFVAASPEPSSETHRRWRDAFTATVSGIAHISDCETGAISETLNHEAGGMMTATDSSSMSRLRAIMTRCSNRCLLRSSAR